jgi:hypothetical protein
MNSGLLTFQWACLVWICKAMQSASRLPNRATAFERTLSERSFFVGCKRIGVVSSCLRGEIVIEGDGIVMFFVLRAVHERHCPVTRMLQELLNRIAILVKFPEIAVAE